MGDYWSGNSNSEPNPFDDIIKLFEKMKKSFGGKEPAKPGAAGSGKGGPGRKILLTIVLGIISIWLLTGIYLIDPGEIGVVRQFGREVSQTGPGPHYRWPSPIERVDIVNMEQVRRAEVGFRTQGNSSIHERRLEEIGRAHV